MSATPAAGTRLAGRAVLVYRRDGRFAPPAAWPQALRAGVRGLDFGARGALFLALDGVDAAEDGLFLVARLGALRGPEGSCLDAQRLLASRAASPATIDPHQLAGNGLVLAVDLDAPRFAGLATLLAVPQLYYAGGEASFVAATDPALLLPLLDRVALDEESLPAHFLFGSVSGDRTYLRGVRRLVSGTQLCFHAGHVDLSQRRRLRDLSYGTPVYDRCGRTSIGWLDAQMQGVVAAGVDSARSLAVATGSVRSEGLAAPLVAGWLGGLVSEAGGASWSCALGDENEVRSATGDGGRRIVVPANEYSALLDRAVEAMGEPLLVDPVDVLQLALAETLAARDEAPRLLLSGDGAEALHGVAELDAIERWRRARERPRLRRLIELAGPLAHLLPGAARWHGLEEIEEDPATFRDPTSQIALVGEVEAVSEWFGTARVERAFELRRELEIDQFASVDLLERVQLIDLVTSAYDRTVARARLFAARGIDLLPVFFDEAAVAAPFAFSERIRYLRPRGRQRSAPLLQELLRRAPFHGPLPEPASAVPPDDLLRRLLGGALREQVEEIARPDWMTAARFAEVKQRRDRSLWSLLVLDAYRRRVLARAADRSAGV